MSWRGVVIPLLWAAAFAIVGFVLSSSYLDFMVPYGLTSVGPPHGNDMQSFVNELAQVHARARLGFVVGVSALFGLVGLAIGRADARGR